MSSSYQPSSSGQGSRRSSSRNRGSGRGGRPPERRSGDAKRPAPTLWQKIMGFFGGSKPAAPARKEVPPPASRYGSGSRDNNGDGEGDNGQARTPAPASSARVIRKPEAVEVTSPRLYVGNLSFDATESDLSELFNGVGQVASVEVVSHRQTQRSKGFAFVQMQTTDEAKRAVDELHDKEFMGRKLVVSGAKSLDEQDGRSEPRFAS